MNIFNEDYEGPIYVPNNKLTEGIHDFLVTDIKDEWYEGNGGTIPACKRLKITMKVTDSNNGKTFVHTDSLFLTEDWDKKQRGFLESVGFKLTEGARIPFRKATDRTGRALFKKMTTKDGREFVHIKNYITKGEQNNDSKYNPWRY